MQMTDSFLNLVFDLQLLLVNNSELIIFETANNLVRKVKVLSVDPWQFAIQ